MSAENRRNSEAESAYVRRNVWGEQPITDARDEVGNTILGDITQPPTIVVAGQQSSIWPAIAIGLAALLPIAGIGAAGMGALAAYYLTGPQEQQPNPEFEDSSVSIGLGRLDDFLQDSE